MITDKEVTLKTEHRTTMTLGSTQAVIAAVVQNLGIGFVTVHAANSHRDKVTAVRIDGLSLERDLNLIYETGRVRGRHTQAFIDYVQRKSES